MSDSTEEMNTCCKILDFNSITDITSTEIQTCANVLFSAKLHRSLDFNVETEESLNRSNSKCSIGDLQLLNILLCKFEYCDQWNSMLLRSLCKVCYISKSFCQERKLH